MKKNIISLVLLAVLVSNFAVNKAFSEDINKVKVQFSQEFNQLENKENKDIEAAKQKASALSSSVRINYVNSNFSFDLLNQDLEKVIRKICKYSNLDYDFPNNSLSGTVSLKINNKPLNEAIQSIFANSAYSYVIKNNILIVKKNAAEVSTPVTNDNVEVQEIKLKYITYEEAYDTLNKVFPAPKAPDNSVDEQKRLIKISASSINNSILLVGNKSDLVQATEIVNKIDKPSPKIMLQCIVTIMDDSNVKKLGTALNSLGAGSTSGLNYLPNGGVSSDIGASGVSQPNLSWVYNLATKVPTNFSVSLDDMITTQKGKIISRPYTTVESGKTAKLISSSNSYIILTAPYPGTIALMQTMQAVQTGTSMEITPLLVDNNLISVKLDISHSYMANSPVDIVSFVINENKASTNLVVKNGETIVIGGLKTSTESSYHEGLPFLRFIPFLSSKQNSKNENEVIFFITPYVIKDTPTAESI